MVSLFSWTKYNPHKNGLRTVLSPLESEVMEVMWREKRATTRTIYTRLKGRHSVNRSTVNVVMSSLCKRGLLSSRVGKGRGGLKYIYKVRFSRARFEREVVGKVLGSLLTSFERTTRKQMKEKVKRA